MNVVAGASELIASLCVSLFYGMESLCLSIKNIMSSV